jgi:DNA-binding NtrC family response regulator
MKQPEQSPGEDTSQAKGQAPRILIVEDEPDVAETLKRVIEASGRYEVDVVLEAHRIVQVLERWHPDFIFTDLMMSGMDGFELIRRVKSFDDSLPVVVVSAYATLENAVEAVKAGAFDFLAKPFSPESVDLILAKVQRDHGLRMRAAEMARRIREQDADLCALRGNSQAMRRLRDWICKVRGTGASVLIEGESGTGKELVARAIHAGKGPFVAVSMAAIPDELAEAELFGYRKGAFTGAVEDRRGLLMEAEGGVLFLDEVNSMSPRLQAKLLRVLEEHRIRPVGSTQDIEVHFRLLSAANQDLEQLVQDGLFRRDLYHRLKVLHVQLPPLRERPEDIPELADYFLQRYVRAHASQARRFAQGVLGALIGGKWPGNVRELENVIEQAVILCPEDCTEIPLDVFPPSLGGRDFHREANRERTGSTLAEMEWHYIRSVLEQTGGNKAQAARILGIDYKTLLRKLAPK